MNSLRLPPDRQAPSYRRPPAASRRTAAAVLAALGVLTIVAAAHAQVPPPPPSASPGILDRVGIDQNGLGTAIPLDLGFRSETGEPGELGRFFGRKPVVLALVYYRCPMLCTMVLNGMLAAFKSLRLEAGSDFEVVVVSFDHRETPELAAAKKESCLREYGRPGTAAGWHFLTGGEESIRRLCEACGFRYFYDARTDQYAHGSGIMVLTPAGVLSRYFYGIEYSARDLRLALVEASEGRIGSLADQVLLLCYRYDPATGRYGLVIMGSLRVASVLVLAALAGFILFSLRRERRARAAAGPPTAAPRSGGAPPDPREDR